MIEREKTLESSMLFFKYASMLNKRCPSLVQMLSRSCSRGQLQPTFGWPLSANVRQSWPEIDQT